MSVEKAELELATSSENQFVHPLTGEAIDLCHAPDDRLAAFLADLREHEHLLREAKRIVTDEALRRMDTRAAWTLHAGNFTLKAGSPEPAEEFDELALREDLLKLVDQGVIDIAALDSTVETIVSYKVRRTGVKALRKLGGVVRETVDRHAREVQKRRYVNVEHVR